MPPEARWSVREAMVVFDLAELTWYSGCRGVTTT